jgi:hypothetical protein
VETIMKLRLAPASLAHQFHLPLRFGNRWRGHETPLRIVQLILIAWLAIVGAQLIARGVSMAFRALA